MSLNSSSSNASLHSPPPSSSVHEFMHGCMTSTVGVFNITAFTIISIFLLLPLYILVLYIAHQRWQQQRSGTTISHSDLFTYNMVISDVLAVLGSILDCVGIHTDLPEMTIPATYLMMSNFYLQISFHTLTCVERYLAAVHPVTYMGLKKANWIQVRDITVVCVWLVCIALVGLIAGVEHISITIFSFCYASFALIFICFCSIFVLCILIRPGPGERGGDRQRVDQLKLRAFYTITLILGVLGLRFVGYTMNTVARNSLQLEEDETCGVWLSVLWLSLPSRLVLPLLFLHRAGKLPCCENNNTAAQSSD